MDRGEVAATVEPSKHDRVEAIGLSVIAGLSGDEGRRDDVAVEPVVGEDPMEDEAGTGGFVTRPDGGFFGEATEEPSDLHEIPREREDLRLIAIAIKDGGSN
jgi:hypothetical protein